MLGCHSDTHESKNLCRNSEPFMKMDSDFRLENKTHGEMEDLRLPSPVTSKDLPDSITSVKKLPKKRKFDLSELDALNKMNDDRGNAIITNINNGLPIQSTSLSNVPEQTSCSTDECVYQVIIPTCYLQFSRYFLSIISFISIIICMYIYLYINLFKV